MYKELIDLSKDVLPSFQAKALALLLRKRLIEEGNVKLRKRSVYIISGEGFNSFQVHLSHSVFKVNQMTGAAGESTKSYFILGPVLGRGSFGTVKLVVKQINLHEESVSLEPDLKHVLKSSSRDRALGLHDFQARAEQETRILRMLYPATADVIVRQKIDINKTYIPMERLGSFDLDTFLKQVYASDAQLEVTSKTLLYICQQVVQSIDTLHKKGIVHQDLKPSNLLFTPATGDIKIADLGLARTDIALDEPISRGVVGTRGYRAPEIDDGPAKSMIIAPRKGEYYALGWILIETLLGKAAVRKARFNWELISSSVKTRLSEPDFFGDLDSEGARFCQETLVIALEEMTLVFLHTPMRTDARPNNLSGLKGVLEVALQNYEYPTVPKNEAVRLTPVDIAKEAPTITQFETVAFETVEVTEEPTIHHFQGLFHLKRLLKDLKNSEDKEPTQDLKGYFFKGLHFFLVQNEVLPDELSLVNIFKLEDLFYLECLVQEDRAEDSKLDEFKKILQSALTLHYVQFIEAGKLAEIRCLKSYIEDITFRKRTNSYLVMNFSSIAQALSPITEETAKALLMSLKEYIYATTWDVGRGGVSVPLPEINVQARTKIKIPGTMKKILDCIEFSEKYPQGDSSSSPPWFRAKHGWVSTLNAVTKLAGVASASCMINTAKLRFLHPRSEETQTFYKSLGAVDNAFDMSLKINFS